MNYQLKYTMPTLAHLKRRPLRQANREQVAHVVALPQPDAVSLRIELRRKELHTSVPPASDMRMWRPKYGWAISATDMRWLHIPENYEIVHRAEPK